MSKSQKAAQAAAERLALAEQENRHQRQAEADRREHERMIAEFRREQDADHHAFMSSLVPQAETVAPAEAPATPPPPRGEDGQTTFGHLDSLDRLPAAPEPVDLANISMAEYQVLRGQLGIDQRGAEHVGRAPGRERQEYMGHQLEDGSGFESWNDHGDNRMVFRSQLADNRRPTPPGYQRRDAATEDAYR